MLSEIIFAKGKLIGYQDIMILHDELLPFMVGIEDRKLFNYSRRKLSIQSATKKWLYNFGIELLPWSASSPDLNPIKNLWGTLARKVCDQQKSSIENIVEFKKGNETLNKLVDSIPNRLTEIAINKGKSTKY